MKKLLILDPGHGMGNRKYGVYDPGAVSGGATEAEIVMDYVNELRLILLERGQKVVRTRVNAVDPAPLSRRAAIARSFSGDIMISFHCNSSPKAQGTETIYRGADNKLMAERINTVLVNVLGTKDRGAKTELQLGRGANFRLAVMRFQPCFLIELGFISHPIDRAKMLDPELRRKACEALADTILF